MKWRKICLRVKGWKNASTFGMKRLSVSDKTLRRLKENVKALWGKRLGVFRGWQNTGKNSAGTGRKS